MEALLIAMLEIVLTPKILDPQESGALGLSLFSLMVNPRLATRQRLLISAVSQ